MAEAMVERDLVAAQGDDRPLGATLERDAVPQLRECHCPFDCTLEACDEYGYCEHLKGFSNDRKCFEPVVNLMVREGEGKDAVLIDTGKRRVVGRNKIQLIQKGDVLVNPTARYFDSQTGGWKVKNLWVSWRVYRKAPAKDKNPAKETPAA